MIEHYDAFISYKHAPEDIKVAEAVQKGLEHFRIPRKIRKKTGKKRIERIFRDKDELPITASLGETISYALDHSDYLIVICSTRTKESEWVQREIEYFLKSHSRQQVLTVLVDGEPQDVIPPILQYEEKAVVTEDGRYQTFRVELEPLSCDYRESFRKAKKVELPRLASALIGCSYDELMNRRRHYAMRRTAIAFLAFVAAAAGFTVYLLRSRENLRRNYLNSLRNQSKYLANESSNMLKNEQRIKALQLALEALPKDDKDDRPVTPEAISALTEATRAYVSDFNYCISAEWNYVCPGEVKGFEISPMGTYLAACDSSNIVTVWNTKSHEKVMFLQGAYTYVEGIRFVSDGELLVWGGDKLALFSVSSGSEIWNYQQSEEEYIYFNNDSLSFGNQGNFYLQVSGNRVIRCNLKTGKLEETIQLPKEKDGESLYIYRFMISPDEDRFAFSGSAGFNLDYLVAVGSMSDTQNAVFFDEALPYIRDMYWVDDEKLILALTQGELGDHSYSINNLTMLKEGHTKLNCIDVKTMRSKWIYDFSSSDVSIYSGFLTLPTAGLVAYCSGDKADLLDMQNGACVHSYDLNDSIVDMGDANEDGVPNFILESGAFSYPAETKTGDNIFLHYFFCSNLQRAKVSNGFYVQQQGAREIIYYGNHVSDPEWKEIDSSVVLKNLYSVSFGDNVLGMLYSEMGTDFIEQYVLSYYDLRDYSFGQSIALERGDEESGNMRYTILGSDDTYLYLLRNQNGEDIVVRVDYSTGHVSVDEVLEGGYVPNRAYKDGKIYYLSGKEENGDTVRLQEYDLNQKTYKTMEMPEEIQRLDGLVVPFPEQDLVFISGQVDVLYDGKANKVSIMDTSEMKKSGLNGNSVAVNKKGTIVALEEENQIQLFNRDGSKNLKIANQNLRVNGFTFWEPSEDKAELLVVYEGGLLYRYDVKTGAMNGVSNVSGFSGSGEVDTTFTKDYDNHTLYIYGGGNFGFLDFVDTESWVQAVSIDNCLGYDQKTDRFITYSSRVEDEYRIGYFKHYTLDELIEKGKDILQGLELTDEEKAFYGIDVEDE